MKNKVTFLLGFLLLIPLGGFANNDPQSFLSLWGESAKTAVGFFWKAGWAFVLGYMVSGAIQAFVPKKKLTRHMGESGCTPCPGISAAQAELISIKYRFK